MVSIHERTIQIGDFLILTFTLFSRVLLLKSNVPSESRFRFTRIMTKQYKEAIKSSLSHHSASNIDRFRLRNDLPVLLSHFYLLQLHDERKKIESARVK